MNLELVSKEDSTFMRILDKLSFWNPHFMKVWTALPFFGLRKIYYPAGMSREAAESRTMVIAHERRHFQQADGPFTRVPIVRGLWNIRWHFAYLFLPIPIGLAYFRMKWEVEAFATGYLAGGSRLSVKEYAEWVARNLSGRKYFWAWPHADVVKRFQKRLKEMRREKLREE